MKKQFTEEFMRANRGCYFLEELEQCSFMQNDLITLSSILDSEIDLKDKYYFCCKTLFTPEQNQIIAIGVAEIVLGIYEKQYPENKAPRTAIQAAKDYLNNKITEEQAEEIRYTASTTAAAASYTNNAAVAAAQASFTRNAAVAAAHAVDAAEAATYPEFAFYIGKDKRNYKEELLQYLKEYCKLQS